MICLADVFIDNLDIFCIFWCKWIQLACYGGELSFLPSCGFAFLGAFSLQVTIIQLSEVKNELLRILTRDG